jgi:hypothetical protein
MGFTATVASLARIADSFDRYSGNRIGGTTTRGILSPYAAPSNLVSLTLPDLYELFGITEWSMMTREIAMQIPAVFRARAILLSLIPDKPLKAYFGADLVTEQPTFLYRTPGIVSPWQRMANTLDDLIFYPYSLWLTQRGAERNGRKDILNAVHCPYSSWQINDLGQIEIANEDGGWDVASEDEVILIPGPSEGLLYYARQTLQGARALDSAWVSRAQNPSPITEVHMTDDISLDDIEMAAVRDDYAAARRATNGSVVVTPAGVQIIDHGAADAPLMIEGRNASRLDIAAFFNLPGAILDASQAQATLTYVTEQNTRASVYDLSIPYWIRPIEGRMSQDDIVARGQSVRFDFSTLAPAAPGPVTED